MRALREPDAFPASDLGLLRALATPEGRPWRAYAALRLWLQPFPHLPDRAPAMTALVLHTERISSPIGSVLILTDVETRLRTVEFEDHPQRLQRLLARHYGRGEFRLVPAPEATTAGRALEAYFAGDLAALDVHLPVATSGTLFQREVWRALRDIPVRQTLSYGELAASIGRPKAARAVGLANGADPIAIVVPCHRVIGADGTPSHWLRRRTRAQALAATP